MATSTDSSAGTPAIKYLHAAGGHLRQVRSDLARLSEMGERMAGPLLKGGRLFIPGIASWWTSEFCGRAGGLMGITRQGPEMMHDGDVAYFALPDPARWQPAGDEKLRAMLNGKGHLFVNGRAEELTALGDLGRIAGFTGGADAAEGSYRLGALQPLVRFRELEQFTRGWAAAGEMIAACVRGGRMPTIYMSVWLEGAMVRNASFIDHDNLKEPWFVPLFHERLYIPPPAPGQIGGAFLDDVERMRQTLLAQPKQLSQAGQWLAEARQAGRRTWVVAVGHSYPRIFAWPEDDSLERPLEWGPSFSSLMKGIPPELSAGDTVLHLGYAPVNAQDVRHWLDRGVRLIHSSPYGPAVGMEPHENFLWLDLPWRPGDATVDLPGYSVRILPLSSSAHTLAYYAILSEMAERPGWS
jgi:hypothetical protein